MKKLSIVLFLIVLTFQPFLAQDTFSIVAVDPETGEVGSAGASCVDLIQFGLPTDDFLGVLIPNVGAINSQAYYIAANQNNATNRMNLGDTPSQIIDWLVANDVQGQPQLRQYGIAAFVDGEPVTAGHTGASTDNYKNHILGPNYAIQGNILLGQLVLDSMEARFLREEGDLACKLMAAMQGANMVGADTRCTGNGTSSLFSFVKVASPEDDFGNPSFLVSVRTSSNDGIEPIDSMQIKFDLVHNCESVSTENLDFDKSFSVFPNPVSDILIIENKSQGKYEVQLINSDGKLIYENKISKTIAINVSEFSSGTYFLKITSANQRFTHKIIIIE